MDRAFGHWLLGSVELEFVVQPSAKAVLRLPLAAATSSYSFTYGHSSSGSSSSSSSSTVLAGFIDVEIEVI
jgi:hypothetical protein